MEIIITIPVDLDQTIIDDFTKINNFTGFDTNGEPETTEQFLKRTIKDFIRNIHNEAKILDYEATNTVNKNILIQQGNEETLNIDVS